MRSDGGTLFKESGVFQRMGRSHTAVWSLLLAMLLLQSMAPFAAATGMSTCTNITQTCDTYDGTQDGTPEQQEWIEGQYHFEMQDTSTIQMELTWMVREFDRSALGFDEGVLADSLEFDGLEENDGAPADLIRSFLGEETAGPGSNTVGEELMASVNNSVNSLLTQGFGTVADMTTDFANTFTAEGQTTACTTNPDIDAQSEGSGDNNVFEPPICFGTQATVTLDVAKFNLAGGAELNVERAYQGLLVMGSEIRTDFAIFAEPGHRSTFLIEPPAFADVRAVDANGTRVVMGDHFAGEWTLDNTQAEVGDSSITRTTSLTMGFRNTSETTMVTVAEGDPGFSLDVTLDLSDERNAVLDMRASLHYLETDLLEEWGIQVVQFSELADVPLLTADGLRLAHHNGLVDLNLFTDAFPVDDIITGVTDGIPGIDLTMSELAWAGDTVAEGIDGPAGGLNYTHDAGCTETGVTGVHTHYCLTGSAAMGYDHPVVLRTVSDPINLRFLDLLSANVDDPTVNDFLTTVQDDDLRRIMEAGFAASLNPPDDVLNSIVPEQLGGTDLQVTVVLPNWVVTESGDDRISLTLSADGENAVDISVRGPSPWEWDHEIKNDDGMVLCAATQRTCVLSSVELDFETFDLHEWRQAVSVEFGLEVRVDMHRLAFLENITSPDDPVHMQFEVIPADLLRLAVDVSSSMDDPLALEEPITIPCDDFGWDYEVCDQSLALEATEEGLTSFVSGAGEMLTGLIHAGVKGLEDVDPAESGVAFSNVDMDAFEVEFELSGIGTPGPVVSDAEAVSFSVSIPKVRIELGLTTGIWPLVNEGADPEFQIISESATALTAPVMDPMAAFMEGFARSLSGGFVNSNGLSFPPPEENPLPVSTGEVDTTIAEEFDLTLSGPMTVTLPKGLKVTGTSSEDLLSITQVDGRDEITYMLPHGELDDDLELRFEIGWAYIWRQIWVYPTTFLIVLSLMFIGWRRRRRRRKARKAALKAAASGAAAQKMAMSDAAFAGYAGVNSMGMMVGEVDELGPVPDYLDNDRLFR